MWENLNMRIALQYLLSEYALWIDLKKLLIKQPLYQNQTTQFQIQFFETFLFPSG